jgi:uncharacterized protein YfaS (alpha-2-macroglobulin family)
MKTKLFLLAGLLATAIVASSLSVFFVSQSKSNSMMKSPEYNDYEMEWKKVDSLVSAGLPKSALEMVEVIYANAQKDSNHPQFIKSTLYKIKLKADFEEEFMETTVLDIEMAIQKSGTPIRQILHSIEADLYWRYYQANRYKFMDRTTAINVEKKDIRTWDMKTLLNAVIKNYRSSLSEKETLKKISLKDFDPILELQKDSKKYRPTLYDFLAHRALDFFRNDESSIIQPAFRFELNKESYFSKASDFKDIQIETKDTLSLKFYAVEILQYLLSFHLNDNDPTALIDADLIRLDFVRDNSTLELKDSLYLKALKELEKNYASHPTISDAGYKIAQVYSRLGDLFNTKLSDQYKWEKKKAFDHCADVIKRYPGTDGALNCRALQQQLERQNLQLTMESVNVPDKPFLALVNFRNTPKLWFKVIQMDYNEERNFRNEYQNTRDLLVKYNSFPAKQSWLVTIPDDGDMQGHSTEIKIPAMSLGYYVVLASTTEQFLPDSSLTAFQSFWVSNISYISQNTNKTGYKFMVLDRESGTALPNVNVKMLYRQYDYRTRKYEYQPGGNFISDAKGSFAIPPLDANARANSFSLEFTYKSDKLVTGDQYYHSGYSAPEERKETRTWFFTDRSIYRPGQTIYFKGIVIDKYKEDYSVKTGHKTTVEFFDVNYQKISEQVFATNDYGSFSGTFTAPSGVLNGSMTIKNESGSVSIRVEEYKRPTFEVVFNPLKGSYKLNETVTVTGSAKAFAGNTIDQGEVKYRVVRHTYFPWKYYWFDYFPSQPQMEIAQGTTTTDSDGNFSIQFIAVPDHSVPQKHQPSFRYMLYADVTDIGGETQSESTSVEVSNIALKVDLGLTETIDRNEFKEIKIRTTNLNGQPEPASGKIIISKLMEPERLLRNRKWETPDMAIIAREEFIKDFPFDIYMDESNPEKFKTEAIVATLNFDTELDTIIKLDQAKTWRTGKYVVEIESKDIFGQDVKTKTYFMLCSKDETRPPVNEINWFHVIKGKGEPGEKASFLIGTKDKNARALYEVVQKDKIILSQWLDLSNEQKLIEIPITEGLRGGFSVNLLFVKRNRSFENQFIVDVPFTNKQIDFEFETFRDKLTPGQKELWKIKLKGHKGEKIAAELLASMYDASLDALLDHTWQFSLYSQLYGHLSWDAFQSFAVNRSNFYSPVYPTDQPVFREYDQLNWFGFNYFGGNFYRKVFTGKSMAMDGRPALPGQVEMAMDQSEGMQDDKITEGITGGEASKTQPEKVPEKFSGMQVRRDFRETAFFYPSLKTNEAGEIEISFTVPESLTKWKLMGLSHSKDLSYGQFEKEIVTQKDLMVMPNAPRFFREGDKMSFPVKIVNLSENALNGEAELRFFDARTMKDITKMMMPVGTEILSFSVTKGNSQALFWNINIPEDTDVIVYQIKARSGNFTDGEEKAIPVLKNRMLVTESMPMPLKGNQTRTFKFEKLINSGTGSKTLKNHKFTLEFSSNPTWYAVQALPYIMESELESADNIFNRYYANSIASYIVNSNPKIKSVFEVWKNFTPDALLSNLEKNEELKSAILQETPWVMDAKNEAERKQRIALLFDLNRMSDELASSLRKLQQKQSPNGGWPWFKGMPESRYITQNIVTGFGHLQHLSIDDLKKNPDTWNMIRNAIYYLDNRIKDDYDWLIKNNSDLKLNHLSYTQIQYLYARSYFLGLLEVNKNNQVAFDYYAEQAKKYWLQNNKYAQGMIALALNRLGDKTTPAKIMASIKEHALYSDEMGMYWRDNMGGYYWHEAPIETQALLIEAFDEVVMDSKSVEQMKIWLLKQKQTQNWKTPKATAEAVYALLLKGSDWLVYDELADIKVGSETINPFGRDDSRVEAGTGYFKTSWSGGDIKPEMGNITVTNKSEGIAWGAVYWQYFENLDKITYQETPLKLDKKLFIERNTDAGPVIEPLKDGTKLKVGDKIKVRIELRSDRDMEYLHMKDMRASDFEPVNVLSGYQYQDGLGYYESTLDASTNFFFERLRKGTYVFEYALKVSQKGDFSNGITTIQCMYAPEFTSHSEGVRVVVE